MPLDNRSETENKSQLTKLRSEIQRLEEFLDLCNQIRTLEQLEGSNTSNLKKSKLESQIRELSQQLQALHHEIQSDESILNTKERPVGSLEQDGLHDRIKSSRTRARSLQIATEDATKLIEQIDKEVAENTIRLQSLYGQLEQRMQEGLHPNTAAERLAELKNHKDSLTAVVRSNIPLKSNSGSNIGTSNADFPQDGIANSESDFFRYFIQDLQGAQRSVEIMSPSIGFERSRQVLPILAKLVAAGRHVMVQTRANNNYDKKMLDEAQKVITTSHRLRITILQRTDLNHNIAIIDEHIAWEGDVNILGPQQFEKTMRRITGTANVKELRRFLTDAYSG